MGRRAGIAAVVAGAFALFALPAHAATQEASFVNPTLIHVPGAFVGLASPGPSSVQVSGFEGTVTDASVLLIDVDSGANLDELDLVLVSPGGRKVLLWSDACGTSALSGVEYTFSDSATSPMPDSGPCPAGAYKPSNYTGASLEPDDLSPFGGPAPPYDSQLSAFDGVAPSGSWSLFVSSDTSGDFVDIGAWALTLDIQPPTGRRAAALKKCKSKPKGKPRRKCRGKAQKLPV